MAKVAQIESPKYTKKQIMKAAKLSKYADAVQALLEDDRLYTMQEVEEIIDQFMKGEVK